MRRLLRLFIILPLLVLLWGTSNSLGATDAFTQAAGLPDASGWRIPGLDKVIEARSAVGQARTAAREKAQRQALKALRAEVSKRYGPEAAAAVPADLTITQIRKVTPADLTSIDALSKTLGVPALATSGGGSGSGGGGGAGGGGPADPGAGEVPFLTAKSYAEARSTIDTLAVKGRAPMTGYSREQFGTAWSDAAGDFVWTRNGCDTRNDVLARDLVGETFKAGSRDCDVVHGTLPYDPYTGKIDRVFDSEDDEYATDLDAEHVVALGNAWVSGAQTLSKDQRAAIANDPLNLMMVDPSANRQKGDADAATWLPANKPYRCAYVSRQIAVKAKYGLWVASAEKSAMEQVLAGCSA